jgi:hypothetical protein
LKEESMSKSIALWVTDERGINSIRRYLKPEEAVRMVEQNTAEPVLHNQTGAIVALRSLREVRRPVSAPHPAMQAIMERRSKASCTAFSKAEVEAIVGMRGKSRTAHMTEDQRAERIRQRWCAEDLVESAQQKLAVYTGVH